MTAKNSNSTNSDAKKRILPICESMFKYRDHECVVLIQPMGHRCGYVGIKKCSNYYGKSYEEIHVDCHGGLTYARNYLTGVSQPYRKCGNTTPSGLWWIGFDCAHCEDANDYPTIYKMYADYPEEIERISVLESIEKRCGITGIVRTREFCEAECRSIVDQLIALEEAEHGKADSV